MFGALRQDSPIYILDKGANPSLKIGTVISAVPMLGTYQNSFNNTVSIEAKAGEQVMKFNQLPSNLTKTYYNNNIVVATDKDAMLKEVTDFVTNSKQALENMPYYERVVEMGDEMIGLLNPQVAREKANVDKINNLEKKVGDIDNRLDTITDMLSKALQKEV